MNGRVSVGHPVDVASGALFKQITDIRLPGKPQLVWGRRYSTDLAGAGPLGRGWVNRYFATLTQTDNKFVFTQPEGSVDTFVDLDRTLDSGGVVRNKGSFQELSCDRSVSTITRWEMLTSTVERYVFHRTDSTGGFALAAIEEIGVGALELIYDQSGFLRGIRNRRSPRALLLGYDSAGRIATISFGTPSAGPTPVIQYAYDRIGHLVEARDALGNSERYEYDPQGRMLAERLKCGQVFTFHYDAQGRCAKTTGLDRFDEKTLKYRSEIGWTEVTNSRGAVARYQCNERGQVVTTIHPLGGVNRYEYDDDGRLTSRTTPTGAKYRYEYDEAGNCATRKLPGGAQIVYEFDQAHVCTAYTDANGHRWERKLDSKHKVIQATDPTNAVWSYHYDQNGYLSRRIHPDGGGRSFNFTEYGELEDYTNEAGVKSFFNYDLAGRLTQLSGTNGNSVQYAYDLLGRVISVLHSGGGRQHLTYDAAGQTTSITDGSGRVVQYRYGSCGHPVSRAGASGASLAIHWGTEPGQITEVVNENGQSYKYEYTDDGHVSREVTFDGHCVDFTYDSAGDCTSVTNGAGETIRYERRPDRRATKAIFPDGGEASFTYDPYGRVTAAANEAGELRFEHDAGGRVTREEQLGVVIERRFNSRGRLTDIRTSTGYAVQYEYDLAGCLTAISCSGTKVLIRREPAGAAVTFDFGPAAQLQNTYDIAGRLIRQALTRNGQTSSPQRRQSEWSYTYDGDGRLLNELGPDGSASFLYDPDDRVTAILRGRTMEGYTYDGAGNITRADSRGGSVNRSYGPGDRLRSAGDISFAYDGAGRVVRKGPSGNGAEKLWEFRWDAVGQLREATSNDGVSWEYTYDAIGRRVRKQGPGTDIRYLWNGPFMIQETGADGSSRSWVYPQDSFTPILSIQAGTPVAVVSDQIGLPRELINLRDGSTSWAAAFTLWGEVAQLSVQTPGVTCPPRFQGQWADDETGLHYNRFRYYDPTLGCFLSPDPLRLAGGTNPYAYGPNPLAWIDPYGLAFLYRGMKTDSNGRPVVHSGETQGGQNAANSLGVRPDEQGMSTNTDPNAIQSHRRPPDFGPEDDPGIQKNSSMFRIDDEQLAQHGLTAVNDHQTHFEIRTAPGVDPSELPERLAAIEPLWQPITRKQHDDEEREEKEC